MEVGMAMSMGRGGPTAEMNVTPLIDVLLTLLVIFMVITPFQPHGEKAVIPQPGAPNDPVPVRSVVVQVVNSSSPVPLLRINQEEVSWDQLGGRLKEIYKLRAERVLFVQVDDEIDWNYAAQVIGIAHSHGIDSVGLMTANIGGPV
jgi:biopolymer transport protein TolR